MVSLQKKTCLVSGCSGFVGNHLCKELLNQGAYVIGIDCLIRDNMKNISDIMTHDNFEFIPANITDNDWLTNIFETNNIDYVSHQAAICIRYCQSHPRQAIDVNVKGTINLLELAAQHKIKKFVAASSASVYGDPIVLPINEDDALLPKNIYGVTKIMNEKSYYYYWREFGLPFIAFRYMNVYGTRQNPDAYYTSVISVWIKKILEGASPIINGDGKQSMDFVHVRDVVQANILALKSSVKNEIFNVGSGTETSLNKLCDTIIKLMNSDLKPVHVEEKSIDVKRRRASIEKIQDLLGYKPSVSLEEGLKEIIEEYKK